MSILIICPGKDPKPRVETLKNQHPEIKIYVYPEAPHPKEVEFALVWNHPAGVFKNYPSLKVIASMGAGVDHILNDPDLPENVTITRIVDEQLATDMAEFVLALIMDHLRNLSFHKDHEQQQLWKPKPYFRISEVKVGILGMGILGTTLAKKLATTGFKIVGWAKTPKPHNNIKVFAGTNELEHFLAESDILVCLLPLTKETENILDKPLFKKLPKNAFLINVARGKHLVEEDLLEMVNNGHLSGAALDVFREEPLPVDHPFWKHPKIQVTPHIASVTNPISVVPQVLENYRRMKAGEPLLNTVDRKKGY